MLSIIFKMFCGSVPAILITFLILKYLNVYKTSPILGIYQQAHRFFYFKFAFIYVTLLIKQLFHRGKWRLAIEMGESGDGTIHVHNQDTYLENIHNLGIFTKSLDGVYFNATGKNKSALVCGVARRPYGQCSAFLYLKVENGELLLSPELPDTTLTQTEAEKGHYRAAGINVSMVIPMRSWKIQYSGEMKTRSDPSKRVKVTVDLTWSTKWHRFHYNNDMCVAGVARDMAREPWSADYFRLLDSFSVDHYEQIGLINGTALIDGKSHSLTLECLRSRTFGPNVEMTNMHRAVLHFIYLANGDRVSLVSVSKPVSYSQLTSGFLCRHSDLTVKPVSSSSFELFRHGERHSPPTDYAFHFTAGGDKYLVQVNVYDEVNRYAGAGAGSRDLRMLERWAEYRVNGIRGWGCTQWLYRNVHDKLTAFV